MKRRPRMKEKTVTLKPPTPTEIVSALLQWACNPRGGNNLYGRTLNGCGRRAVPGLGTMAVSLDRRGRYMFLYDPEWLAEQTRSFQIIGFFHEASHIILQHLERGLRIRLDMNDDAKYARIKPIMQIAVDMAANDVAVRPMLHQSKAFGEHYDRLVWPESRDYPKGESFETYLALLLKDLKDEGWDPDDPGQVLHVVMGAMGTPSDGQGDGEGKGGEGDEEGDESGGQGDDTPEWIKDLASKTHAGVDWEADFEDMNDAEVERALSRANKESRKIVKNAVEQTRKSRGTIPGSLERIIEELLQEHTIPWQTVLMGLVKSEMSSKLDESTSQPNPCYFHLAKYGIAPYPGYQHNFAFNIVLAADTSGSVSDEEFTEFMSEMQGLIKDEDDVTARLLMFDARIQHEQILEDGDVISMREFASHRFGYGGTSFNPPLQYISGDNSDDIWEEEAKRSNQKLAGPPDLMVIFTDGYAPIASPRGPVPDLLPPCPLIWVLTPSGQEDDLMAPRVLRITR
jgi:predicted metal-dependent peptidase